MNYKKLYIVLIALGTYTSSYAQEVKLGLGLGYSHLLGDLTAQPNFNGAVGISGYIEVGYGFNRHIDVSFLYQSAAISVNYSDDNQGVDLLDIENLIIQYQAYLINSRYFFREYGFRPYLSLGMGYGATHITNTLLQGDINGGFAFRAGGGFQVGILNISTAYLKSPNVGDYGVSDLTINLGLSYSFDISKSSIIDNPEEDKAVPLEEKTNNTSTKL